ncbi:MAG: HAMP domain-containing sensor histidine kinase [Eubacteriales bacterium]|nr:HAMP domain-containing sensor histidine kinase [Eubacteriales bacterium]
MKLKTKLVISFCIILFVPMVLIGLAMATLGNHQLHYLQHYAEQVEQEQQSEQTVQESQKSGWEQSAEPDHPSMLNIVPEIRGFLKKMAALIFVVLLVTAGLLLGWIYTSVNIPINRLRTAAHNIAEGNLNFTVEASGEDEISDLCRDFEEMRQRLVESTEEKLEYDRESKELISNISHDLKTPIASIKGYVEGIMDGVADTPEKMDRYIRTIYNKANDMDRLINELTFYSKIDTNRIPYDFHKVNVAAYFEDCVEEVGLELESDGMTLRYRNEVAPEVLVIADPEQIKRVINNIVSNSVKYMDKKAGRIDILVKDVGDFIQIEIEDNGRGIGPKELPYIFDRFYRADASRHSAGGRGIGLSIVKKIVEDHGGKIWAVSQEGVGTVMCFVLRKYQEVPIDE